jgi:CRISPR-associated protein Csb2
MFAIAWEYLTGRAVACHPTDREEPEWPPHPDRVFQALVAAWGETGCGAEGRAALAWLENAGLPSVTAPPPGAESGVEPGACPPTYVPVNDVEGPERGAYRDAHHALLPAGRTKKDRRFPSMLVGQHTCAVVWPQASPPDQVRAALEALCRATTSIGHSRSLVRAWTTVEDMPPTWVPTQPGERPRGPVTFLRVPTAGRLEELVEAYGDGGKTWQRPPTAQWHAFRRADDDAGAAVGPFDPRLIVLRVVGGDRPTLRQTLAFTVALRGALLPKADEAARRLVSGHEPDGTPIAGTHVAYLPLADVGHGHADGHLMGLALALPRDANPAQEQGVVRALALLLDVNTEHIKLTAGHAGCVHVAVEDRPAPPRGLRPETWTAPSNTWATVTPLVLDRLPPKRCGDPAQAKRSSQEWDAYQQWVGGQVRLACQDQGLPHPVSVEFGPVSRFSGAPPARDMAPVRRKPDGAKRWHVHVVIKFATLVAGPLVLGAGRYRGYGLCRPLRQGEGS